MSRPRTLVLVTAVLAACASAPDAALGAEAGRVLQMQAECWNRGDLRGFVASYAAETTFFGEGGLVRGSTDLLARYERAYPNADKRGVLTFTVLETRALGADRVLVLGEYRLARADPDRGWFTLVMERKTDGRLVIAHDHTTRAKPG